MSALILGAPIARADTPPIWAVPWEVGIGKSNHTNNVLGHWDDFEVKADPWTLHTVNTPWGLYEDGIPSPNNAISIVQIFGNHTFYIDTDSNLWLYTNYAFNYHIHIGCPALAEINAHYQLYQENGDGSESIVVPWQEFIHEGSGGKGCIQDEDLYKNFVPESTSFQIPTAGKPIMGLYYRFEFIVTFSANPGSYIEADGQPGYPAVFDMGGAVQNSYSRCLVVSWAISPQTHCTPW